MPSFGHLHLAALNAADYVLIPVHPAPYALADLKDLLDTSPTQIYFRIRRLSPDFHHLNEFR